MLCVVLVALAACGGGDGDSGAVSSPQTDSSSGSAGSSVPTIQGTPVETVVAGKAYSFQPTASDPSGNTLKFSVANLPSWASFNTNTGRLSGTPGVGDIGTFANISISVSNGSATATLRAFSITVSAAGIGSATLSWMAPTENTDGTVLTNLAGYRILYGRTTDELDQSITIDNPSISSYVVENLASGTWYFAVIAVNSNGVSSALSNMASKTIG